MSHTWAAQTGGTAGRVLEPWGPGKSFWRKRRLIESEVEAEVGQAEGLRQGCLGSRSQRYKAWSGARPQGQGCTRGQGWPEPGGWGAGRGEAPLELAKSPSPSPASLSPSSPARPPLDLWDGTGEWDTPSHNHNHARLHWSPRQKETCHPCIPFPEVSSQVQPSGRRDYRLLQSKHRSTYQVLPCPVWLHSRQRP